MPVSVLLIVSAASVAALESSTPPPESIVEEVKVTVLSTNLADEGIGEWGFSALVEVDGNCLLFDTGRYPRTVLRNAEELGVDLSCVTDVVLSHFHPDHIGGLVALQESVREDNPQAFARVHVAEGFFRPRRRADTSLYTRHRETMRLVEEAGLRVVTHSGPAELLPGVWLTGPIHRLHPEKNYNETIEMLVDGEWVEDSVPDDQALTILTPEGHIVVAGCAHAGIINTLEHIQTAIGNEPVHALIGGLHLFQADQATLSWTAEKMADANVEHFMGGHCTGIESVFRLREGTGLPREKAVVAAVGSHFKLGEGVESLGLAR